MDKKELTEELKNLIKYIGQLEINLDNFKNNVPITERENKEEYRDMELQLSAMNLYKLYLEKRAVRR